MSREDFYSKLTNFLRALKPEREVPDPTPQSHLWVQGYLDSVGMLELLLFLEDLVGHEITLGRNALDSFNTMESIYENYAVDDTASA